MRKIFSFLVAAVFVATAASAVFAQGKFRAEVSFAADATVFGIGLFQMAGDVPAVGDTSTGTIHWSGTTFFPVIAGNGYDASASTYVPSKVYAKISTDTVIAPEEVVQIYTANASAAAVDYKFHATVVSSAPMMGAMAAMKKTSPAAEKALPLTYRIIDPTEAEYPATSMTAFPMHHDVEYGVYFVKDLVDPTYSEAGVIEVGRSIAAEYSTIATDKGIRYGRTNATQVDYVPAKEGAVIFFASSFYEAKTSHKYGTDTLTVALDVE